MRYIRYKYQKQQINFLNCNDLDKWIDTCQTRVIGFDSVCESNCNCGEIRDMEYQPQYRTKKLNPNYSYECVDMDRHYKLQKQISYDNGITWMDIDEYEIGELYESNSPFCSAEVIIYDWFPSGRYKCVGYNKINEEVKRVSFDNGLNWSDLSFVDDNGNVTYEYRFNASNIEENCCDCGYREYEWRISDPIEYVCDVNTKSEVWYKWQYCPTDPSLDVKLDEMELRNPVQDEDYCGINVYFVWDASSKNYCEFILNNRSYSATTENSVLNDDGTYTYSASLSDLGITEVTTRNRMFFNSDNLLKVYKVPKSNGASIQNMFVGCTNLTYLDKNAISDTSNVTNMSYMFRGCSSLTSLDLSSFNTSKVTGMSYMFYDCNKLTSLDLSSFNTSNVTNMNWLFRNCNKLTSLDLSNWDTSNVTYMSYMFYGCNSLNEIIMDNCSCDTVSFIIDRLNEASLRNVLIYSNSGCEGTICHPTTDREYNGYRIEVIKPSCEFNVISNFNVYKVYTETNTDINCNVTTSNGEEIYLENQIPNRTNPSGNNNTDEVRTVTAYTDYGEYTFEQGVDPYAQYNIIYEWDTSKSGISIYRLNGIGASTYGNPAYIDYNDTLTSTVSAFTSSNITNLIKFGVDTTNVTNMSKMFYNCYYLTSLDLSSFNTSNVTNMSYMFYYCWKLTSLDLSSFNTSAVTNMSYMFYECNKLTSLDLSNFDTSKVTDMNSMFNICKSLTSLDLSSFNTSLVTDMKYMFSGCNKLTSLDLSSFNTSLVTDMKYMFSGCFSLTSLDLTSFNTSKVTKMSSMFYNCSGLTSLDLSSFNTSKVTDIYDMFTNCSALTSLDLSNWDASKVTSYSYMFDSCNLLRTITMKNCNETTINKIKVALGNAGILSNVTIITD